MTATPGIQQATLAGVPLKLVSLVTLTLQNSALTILLHYSRKSVPSDKMYSAASAVLLNELLKGSISLSIAYRNAVVAAQHTYSAVAQEDSFNSSDKRRGSTVSLLDFSNLGRAAGKMRADVFSSDCWKLSIPACLYVIQNNLQFVAASNLDVPTFQVTYNLKILTTALFSVALLRRKLTLRKWVALFFLAAGVGIVQLQSTAATGGGKESPGERQMNKLKGLTAVACACMTSGLAGVYFEMVLKGSKADLWIRNVQLSFFSLLPAMLPVFFPNFSISSRSLNTVGRPVPVPKVFANFGFWAWAVVLTQVLGGLVTALVIKYSDNILKGFATSLAIIISFLAGVILFKFHVTTAFVIGTIVVVGSTYLYNMPDSSRLRPHTPLVPPPTALSYPPSHIPRVGPSPSRPIKGPHSSSHAFRITTGGPDLSQTSTAGSFHVSTFGGGSSAGYKRPPISGSNGHHTPDFIPGSTNTALLETELLTANGSVSSWNNSSIHSSPEQVINMTHLTDPLTDSRHRASNHGPSPFQR